MHVLLLKSPASQLDAITEVLKLCGFTYSTSDSAAEIHQADLPQDLRLICMDSAIEAEQQNALCIELRNAPLLRMLPVVVLFDDSNTPGKFYRDLLRSGATEILPRSDPDLLKRSFNEYAHRFRHEQLDGRVLLVEDDPLLADVISTHLGSRGLHVDSCPSAEQAVDMYNRNNHDLVITDVLLEGPMTGLALLRTIRANPTTETRVPVLVISAFDDPARKMEILYSGADDYLPKPLEPVELLTRAGNLLRTKFQCDAIREQKEELRILSTTDLLTGLHNKRYLYESGTSMLSNAHRHAEAICLLVIDLDKFKPINDQYGHDVGDKVLASIGKTIHTMTRSGDIAARFGGDEFVVLLSHSDLDAAEKKADELRAAIRELCPGDIKVTASIGITRYPNQGKADFFALFRSADRAVYRAKELGGDRVCVASPQDPDQNRNKVMSNG